MSDDKVWIIKQHSSDWCEVIIVFKNKPTKSDLKKIKGFKLEGDGAMDYFLDAEISCETPDVYTLHAVTFESN